MFGKIPFSTAWMEEILLSFCDDLEKRERKFIHVIAKRSRQAYLIGERDKKSGRPMVLEEDVRAWINENAPAEELAESAFGFVYQMYKAGYLL